MVLIAIQIFAIMLTSCCRKIEYKMPALPLFPNLTGNCEKDMRQVVMEYAIPIEEIRKRFK